MAVPPPPARLDLEVEVWPRGRPIVRVFAATFPSTSFNPTASPARFRPVVEADGAGVPTLYAGADADVALAETVMHDLSARTTRIPYARLVDRAICTLLPARDLRLAALHGYGLKKARVTRKRLIDTPPSRYPETAAWGQAIYEHRERVDGIVWMSRRFDSSKALLLWSTRVGAGDLGDEPGTLMLLAAGDGYELAAAAALRAGCVIVRP